MSFNLKVGIVGLGAIGLEIAKTIDSKKLPNMNLVSVSSRDLTKAQNKLENLCETCRSHQKFNSRGPQG